MIEAQKSSKNYQFNKFRQAKRSAFEMLPMGYEAVRRTEENWVADTALWRHARWNPGASLVIFYIFLIINKCLNQQCICPTANKTLLKTMPFYIILFSAISTNKY